MDDTFIDGELVAQFVGIVAAANLQVQLFNGQELSLTEEELEIQIEEGMAEIARIYEKHPRFSQRAYTQQMIKKIQHAGEENLWPIFSDYCAFLTAIDASKELPNLLERFKARKWWEWTSLQLSRQAFLDVAFCVIDGAAIVLEETGQIEFDVAQAVNHVSLAFEIPLPRELREHVCFHICDTPDEYEGVHWDQSDDTPSVLQ